MSLSPLLALLPGLRALAGEMWTGLRSPWALLVLGALGLAAWTGFVYRHGAAGVGAEARAAAAEAKVAALEFDLAAARRLQAEAEAARAADDARTAALTKRISDYETSLAGRPACGFGPDDVRLLYAAQGLDPAALDREPRSAAAAGRSAPGAAAAAGGAAADCRAFAARMSAAAAEANRRLDRGRAAWERMRAIYREGRP